MARDEVRNIHLMEASDQCRARVTSPWLPVPLRIPQCAGQALLVLGTVPSPLPTAALEDPSWEQDKNTGQDTHGLTQNRTRMQRPGEHRGLRPAEG